jgi:hypothetical protein
MCLPSSLILYETKGWRTQTQTSGQKTKQRSRSLTHSPFGKRTEQKRVFEIDICIWYGTKWQQPGKWGHVSVTCRLDWASWYKEVRVTQAFWCHTCWLLSRCKEVKLLLFLLKDRVNKRWRPFPRFGN